MVMADRPEVRTAAAPIAAVDAMGLAQQLALALARVPFRRPWQGDAGLWHNLGLHTTRELIRSFMGYAPSLPIEEFRSLEQGLDALSKVVLRPVVDAEGVRPTDDELGGVPGVRYRPRSGDPVGRIVYLHGEDAASPTVSALTQDVSDWPPVFITWGGDEMFRDPIRTLVAHLDAAGVPTTASEAAGMFHVSPILMPWADASRSTYRAVAAFVLELMGDADG